jgi:hypothetical protein
MITKENLPAAYVPYERVTLCGNEVIGPSLILTLGNSVPILIGKGASPLVWLQALTAPNSEDFRLVVEASIPKHPAMTVLSTKSDAIEIRTGPVLVLRVAYSNADHAVIDMIDLRPLGINLYGDTGKLHVGNMSFAGSTFNNLAVLVAFGAPSAAQ